MNLVLSSLLRLTKLQTLELTHGTTTSQMFKPLECVRLQPDGESARFFQNLLPNLLLFDNTGSSCGGQALVGFAAFLTRVKATLRHLIISWNTYRPGKDAILC
ncbi:MAG: hypothetical protein HC767_01430 [Akkermansiaceae bacterium]|nr:hypothetical protein [Akkermansiaceae bacterium]